LSCALGPNADRFQVDPSGAGTSIQADAIAEEDGARWTKPVNQPRGQALLGNIAAEDADVLAVGGRQGGGDGLVAPRGAM